MKNKKIKKILILIDTNVGGKGGAETHLWNLLNGIDKSRFSVDVIYFDADDLDSITSREKIEGIGYYKVPIRKVYSLSEISNFKEIYRIMKTGNYDCVVSFFESSDIITATLGKLAGIKMRLSNRRDTGFRNSKKLESIYKLINKFFTGFIAVSEAVKESVILQGVAPKKVQVVYNSVNVQSFEVSNGSEVRQSLSIEPDKIVYGMVANLNPVKNHVAVIDALGELHNEGKKAHLVLAGEGVLRGELEQQADKLGLKSYIHFLGTRDDVKDILASLDIFILASHTEGLSNALLEAMASRKPVIASRVGGNIEVVEDGVSGLLVSTDSSSIAQAMRQLYDSKQARDEMGKESYDLVDKNFSMETMLEHYSTIFDNAYNQDY